jgi:hypothetical protein
VSNDAWLLPDYGRHDRDKDRSIKEIFHRRPVPSRVGKSRTVFMTAVVCLEIKRVTVIAGCQTGFPSDYAQTSTLHRKLNPRIPNDFLLAWLPQIPMKLHISISALRFFCFAVESIIPPVS